MLLISSKFVILASANLTNSYQPALSKACNNGVIAPFYFDDYKIVVLLLMNTKQWITFNPSALAPNDISISIASLALLMKADCKGVYFLVLDISKVAFPTVTNILMISG